jgi:hypothetical protein
MIRLISLKAHPPTRSCPIAQTARRFRRISPFSDSIRLVKIGFRNEDINAAEAIRHYFHDLDSEERGFLNENRKCRLSMTWRVQSVRAMVEAIRFS